MPKYFVKVNSTTQAREGRKAYVLYCVEIYEGTEENKKLISKVSRRYSEFHTIHTTLMEAYPDKVPKAFPEKTYIFSKTEPELVSRRQVLLEAYISQVMNNPALCDNPVVRSILFTKRYPVDFVVLAYKPE